LTKFGIGAQNPICPRRIYINPCTLHGRWSRDISLSKRRFLCSFL